jgi:hypothetical protein
LFSIGNGERTSFWADDWLGMGALAVEFPVLFSHALNTQVPVSAVLRSGLRCNLVPRLTAAGDSEFATVCAKLAPVHLSDSPDSRPLRLCTKKNGDLSVVAALYKLAMETAAKAPFSKFVWENFTPSKAKFFAWLLVQGKIQSRGMLLRKRMITPTRAVCPICLAEIEDATHIIFRCPLLQQFLSAIGACRGRDVDDRGLHELPHGPTWCLGGPPPPSPSLFDGTCGSIGMA